MDTVVERIELVLDKKVNCGALAKGVERLKCVRVGPTKSITSLRFKEYLKDDEIFGTCEMYSGEGESFNIFIKSKSTKNPIAFLRGRPNRTGVNHG
jgi:hypothetical protein